MNVDAHVDWPKPVEKAETPEEHARWVRSFFSQKEWDHLQAREQAEQSELEMAKQYPEIKEQLMKQYTTPRMADAFSCEEYYEEKGDVEGFIKWTEESEPPVETPARDGLEEKGDAWVDEDPHPFLDEGDDDDLHEDYAESE